MLLNILQIFKNSLCRELKCLVFFLCRDLGEVMDFELDVECSVDPETEASSSKTNTSDVEVGLKH